MGAFLQIAAVRRRVVKCCISSFSGVLLSLAWGAALAQVQVPSCADLGQWALKLDRNVLWQPNSIGGKARIPEFLVSGETAVLFGKPLLEWSEEDTKVARQAVLDCRKSTKDKAESAAYNVAQSTLVSRVAGVVKGLAQARADSAKAMSTLSNEPASFALLRFLSALAAVATPEGYSRAQRTSTGGLSNEAAAAARSLLTSVRELTQSDITEIVATPASKAAEAMRAQVAEGLVAEINSVPANGQGLLTLEQMTQALLREYGPVLKSSAGVVRAALEKRRSAVSEEVTSLLIQHIGESEVDGGTAFADIDMRTHEALLPYLPSAQATRVREAAEARRQQVAETLLAEMQRSLATLPRTNASIQQLEQLTKTINSWPSSANPFKPRFLELVKVTGGEILAEVNRAEAGPLRGRIYESPFGHKLEFVDQARVFFKEADQTAAGTYTEEKDGRVVITINQHSIVWEREGARLKSGEMTLARVK